jgi:cell division protein FtsW (lipid II flippase)
MENLNISLLFLSILLLILGLVSMFRAAKKIMIMPVDKTKIMMVALLSSCISLTLVLVCFLFKEPIVYILYVSIALLPLLLVRFKRYAERI